MYRICLHKIRWYTFFKFFIWGTELSTRLSYGLDGKRFVTRQWQKNFLFSKTTRPALKTIPSTVLSIPGFFPHVKRPGRDADHSPPHNAEFKNEYSYPSAPCARLHSVRRDNFTFAQILPQLHYIITLDEYHEILISLQTQAMDLKFSFKGTSHPGLLGFMNLYIVSYLDPLPYPGEWLGSHPVSWVGQ